MCIMKIEKIKVIIKQIVFEFTPIEIALLKKEVDSLYYAIDFKDKKTYLYEDNFQTNTTLEKEK